MKSHRGIQKSYHVFDQFDFYQKTVLSPHGIWVIKTAYSSPMKFVNGQKTP